MATDYLLTPSTQKSVLIGYSQNDFFYQKVEFADQINDKMCLAPAIKDASCNNDSDLPKTKNCITKVACENREKAMQLQQIQNSNNGSIEKNANTKIEHDFIIYNIINLGIGIFAMIGFIIFFKPLKK